MTDPRTDQLLEDKHMYVGPLPVIMRALRSRPPRLTVRDSRPGILVLINDADWELEGEESYQIQPHDNILFVTTLHGG